MYRFAHKKGAIKLAKEVVPALLKKRHWRGEMTVVKKNKQIVSVDLICSLLSDEKNKPEYFVAIFSDITELKQAEKKLKESERRLALAVEGAGLGLWDQDFSSGKTIRNERWAQMLGYELDEIEKSRLAWKELIHPDDLATLEKSIKEHKQGKSSLYSVEHRMRSKDGEWKWIHNWGRIVERDKNGSPLRALGVHLDITERKQAEEAVRKSEARLNEAQHIAHIGSWELDLTTNKLIWSDEVYRLFDLEPQKFGATYEAFLDNIYPDDREFVNNAYTESVKNKTPYDIVHRLLLKDGTIKFVNERCETFYDDAGNAVRSMGMIQDITEQKKMISELMEREEKYRTLTQNLNVGVYRSTPGKNGKFVEVNPTFLKMFEFKSKSELERYKAVDFYSDPLDRENIEEKLFSKGFLINEEVTLRKKDGTRFNASVFATIAKDESGNITHYDGIVEDITERKKAEAELKESHDRYESIFDGAVNGIIYSDWKGKILAVNPAFTKFTGIKKEDLVGKDGIQLAKQLLTQTTMVEGLKIIKAVLKGDAVSGFPIEYNNRFLVFYTPEQKGKPGITVMVRDVTERNKARENLALHQENLQTLSNELTMAEEKARRRLAITLHDKLGQALALANFKTGELNKQTTDSEHKKMLDEISSFIDEAINESRNITYELSPPVLYEMGLVPAISFKLDDIEKNNKIKTSLLDQSESYVFEEKIQIILFRTISELLQNVIKHSEAGNVNVSFRLLINDYRITVSDNGIGFDLEVMKDKALSRKKFGLFSIMERIRYIGGEVNINTAPKKGTKVVINLPIKN